jgi:hypothetical protein
MFHLNLILFILLLLSINKIYLESFVNYRNIQFLPYNIKYYKRDINIKPKYNLRPGYNDMNLKFKNKKNHIYSNKYCNEKPYCYPCNGWKFFNHPICKV